jgi:hypothetical protein
MRSNASLMLDASWGSKMTVEEMLAEIERLRALVARLSEENAALTQTLTCGQSEHGTHRCVRCDSEVE